MLQERKLAGGGVWIDLLDPSPEEAGRVAQQYKVRVAPREELDEIETSSRLSRDGDTLYMNMPVATLDGDGTLQPSPLGFVLTDKVFITIHFAHLHTTESVLTRVAAETGEPSAPDVFAMMMESMVDFSADQLETISAAMTRMSQKMFRRGEQHPRNIRKTHDMMRHMLTEIGYAGEQLAYIRETLLALSRIITYALDTCRTWKENDFLERLETARHDLKSLIEHETHLSDKSQFLLDANLGFINTEQNDIFKVLTIVSVVGIPPTLVASMYGMNFHYMPELAWHWGYPFGLGLIAASTLVPIIWFKWRGWW